METKFENYLSDLYVIYELKKDNIHIKKAYVAKEPTFFGIKFGKKLWIPFYFLVSGDRPEMTEEEFLITLRDEKIWISDVKWAGIDEESRFGHGKFKAKSITKMENVDDIVKKQTDEDFWVK